MEKAVVPQQARAAFRFRLSLPERIKERVFAQTNKPSPLPKRRSGMERALHRLRRTLD